MKEKSGGGTDLERGYGDVPRSWPPFFQASRRSLAYQFTIIAPLLCPSFSNFRKIFHFQPCFGQNFSSQDANFPNFRSLDPSFFKENPLPRPYFWKPVWHTPTKKKVECPPPREICSNLKLGLYVKKKETGDERSSDSRENQHIKIRTSSKQSDYPALKRKIKPPDTI